MKTGIIILTTTLAVGGIIFYIVRKQQIKKQVLETYNNCRKSNPVNVLNSGEIFDANTGKRLLVDPCASLKENTQKYF